jgi:DNA polymerase-1
MHPHDGGAYADVILNGDIHTANQEAAGLASRSDAKKFIYSFLYGAGDKKIADDLNMSVGRTKKMKAQFLESLPALAKVQDNVIWNFNKDKMVDLPDGREVQCRTEHAALNTKLQGAGAIVSKYWMVVADLRVKAAGLRAFQMAYVHDELQWSCHKDDAKQLCEILEAASLEAGDRLNILMPIHSEANIGSNWKDCH